MAAQIFTLVKILQDGLPIHKPERISTINFVFRLHTKYVSTIFIATGVLLFIQQLLIDHLKCFKPLEEGTPMESAVLNQYCYATGTYAILNETYKFTENKSSKENKFYFHHYFQWVPIVLICQGLTFYLPEFLWHKFWENGRLEALVSYRPLVDQPQPQPVPQEEVTVDPADNPSGISFAKTLFSPQNLKYFYGFIFCEFLNFIIVLLSFFFTDWLLQGHFKGLGPLWIEYLHVLRTFPQSSNLHLNKEASDNISLDLGDKDTNFYTSRRNFEIGNPLELAFPTLFTCEWTKPAFKNVASVTYSNIKCVMGLNLTHQRIYLVFWFGFVLLFVINLVHFVYRSVLSSSSNVRREVLLRKAGKKGLKSTEEMEMLKGILRKMEYYDCFILQRILANVDSEKFARICGQIDKELESERVHRSRWGLCKNFNSMEMEPIKGHPTNV